MTATWNVILNEMLTGSLSTVLNLLKVMVPLMITIQLLMAYELIEKLAVKMEGLGRLMGISKNAMFPLLVAVVMGVSYGAGTIIELNKANPISSKDLALIGVFMYLCHGVIETAMLMGVAGASVPIITAGRLLVAFLITAILARTKFFRKLNNEIPARAAVDRQ